MKPPPNERARWLAQHIVPHERAIRSWLARRTHDLDIDDIVREMYARLAALDNVEDIRNPRQYAAQTAILLRRVEGLSQKEVADKLGISVKTVEKYMAQSVRFLIQTYGRGGKGA